MRVVPVTTSTGLPDDYAQLTEEGRRQARINACRQWMYPWRNSIEKVKAVKRSLFFFDRYYLHPDPEEDHDPGFYDTPPLREPLFHYGVAGVWHTGKASIVIAPRGSGKSSLIRKMILLELLSMPKSHHVYMTSSNPNAEYTGAEIRSQLTDNRRLILDWEKEYGSTLKPKAHTYPWGTKYFWVGANKSRLRCLSVESKSRGIRPIVLWLDDPEFDAKASTSMALVRGYMDTLIHRIAMPMVLRPNASIRWMATFVSKRHYAWAAMQEVDGPEGRKVAADPRFDGWERVQIRAVEEKNGKLVSCWPEMWPVDDQEKERLGLDPSTLTIPQIERLLGSAAFRAEMMADPGGTDSGYFDLDLDPRGRHSWWIEDPDELVESEPLSSDAKACWRDKEGRTVRVPLKAFLRKMSLFQVVDTSYTVGPSSDRKAVMLMGFGSDNTLFVLDLWSDRKQEQILVERAFGMADRYGCRLCFVESVRDSHALYLRMVQETRDRLIRGESCPAVKALKPPVTMSKTEKIATLDVRFEHGLVKLPLFKRRAGKDLWWIRLIDQIQGFNPEARDGGLQHDDELDCLASSVLVSRLARRGLSWLDGGDGREGSRGLVYDPDKALSRGERSPPGLSLPNAFGVQKWDPDTFHGLLAGDRRARTRF